MFAEQVISIVECLLHHFRQNHGVKYNLMRAQRALWALLLWGIVIHHILVPLKASVLDMA